MADDDPALYKGFSSLISNFNLRALDDTRSFRTHAANLLRDELPHVLDALQDSLPAADRSIEEAGFCPLRCFDTTIEVCNGASSPSSLVLAHTTDARACKDTFWNRPEIWMEFLHCRREHARRRLLAVADLMREVESLLTGRDYDSEIGYLRRNLHRVFHQATMDPHMRLSSKTRAGAVNEEPQPQPSQFLRELAAKYALKVKACNPRFLTHSLSCEPD